ncbi:hypothetical protein [Geomonas agri]|uniref:hypothetical protein n=1 Tax=Geomonas agri TaxID=2873702 RepID=UPI001CD7CAF7|nr:hypothetical protein [Geomonas agri]
MEKRELTPHQVIAKRCGLHQNALAVFQRLYVVPRNVAEITDEHIKVLRAMKSLMTDPILLRIQLKRLGKWERGQLVEHCDDAAKYKRWERRAISMFIAAYLETGEGEEVTIGKVLGHLQKRFRVQPTAYIKYRLELLRIMVEKRMQKEPNVNHM